MSYIDNWFHFYETAKSFEIHKNQGLINPDSICFIKETSQIYTQNTLFGICKSRFEELEKLVINHNTKINDILGIEGSSVGDGIINNIADLVNFLDGFTDEDNLKDFLDAMRESIINMINTLASDLRDQIQGIHDNVGSINSQIEALNIRTDSNGAAIDTINSTIADHLRNYTSLKNNYYSFRTYTENVLNSINSSINSLGTSLDTLHNQFVELDEKFDNVENEVAKVEAYLEEAKLLVRQLEDRVTQALVDMEAFKREVRGEIDTFRISIGQPNGIAPLDTNGMVPASHLPSYVDDVLEFASKAAFPIAGETGKIYVSLDDNLTYRWSGSAYIEISKSLGLGETTSTAYPGNKGKKNADDIAAHKADTNNPHRVTKDQLGLDKVNNTADIDKPISTVQRAALDVLTNSLDSHVDDTSNPHNVTKEQVGLGNVDNTSDLEKPISRVAQDALDTKVDKINGKGLSTNDFTNDHINKLNNALTARRLSSEAISQLTGVQIGELIYNITTNKYVYYNGTSWEEVGGGEEIDLSNYVTKESLDTEIDTLDAVIDTKVDKVTGKGLSTNDFTDALKQKLDGIAANANNYSLPTATASVKGGVKIGSGLTMSGETVTADEQIKWRTIE